MPYINKAIKKKQQQLFELQNYRSTVFPRTTVYFSFIHSVSSHLTVARGGRSLSRISLRELSDFGKCVSYLLFVEFVLCCVVYDVFSSILIVFVEFSLNHG